VGDAGYSRAFCRRQALDEPTGRTAAILNEQKTDPLMKVVFLVIGKTDAGYLQEGIALYEKRLRHYLSYEMTVIPDLKKTKGLTTEQQKAKEGELILQNLNDGDQVVLLDENGRELSSVEFADFLRVKMVSGLKRLVFVVGGPYGFSPAIYARANAKLSLSQMTFSHQMVRLIFLEQLYRANTILKNEPYHHV
jgi:23S rRNA (pseudouridine1915-N3)-methyltransferase